VAPSRASTIRSSPPFLAVSPGFASIRIVPPGIRRAVLVKLDHSLAVTAEPSPSRIVEARAAQLVARPAVAVALMTSMAAASDVTVLPALASFDAPIGDHDRLIELASRPRDPADEPGWGGVVASLPAEPDLTSGPAAAADRSSTAHDPHDDLLLAARPGRTATTAAEHDPPMDGAASGTPLTMIAHVTPPRLLAEQVTLQPHLLLTEGETTIRLVTGVDSPPLKAGFYEAVIEWGGAHLPIAPLIVGNEPVEVAFRIEPSTVTLRFEGVADERVFWTLSRSEGGTLRVRGPIVSESVPPGDYVIEAEVDGELRRHPLRIGIGEAHTVVVR
jgi:hypothetical protein